MGKSNYIYHTDCEIDINVYCKSYAKKSSEYYEQLSAQKRQKKTDAAQMNKNINVLQAEKGNFTVIMDIEE